MADSSVSLQHCICVSGTCCGESVGTARSSEPTRWQHNLLHIQEALTQMEALYCVLSESSLLVKD